MPADTDPVVVPAGVGQNDPVIIPAPTPSAGGDNGFLAKINAALGSDNYREPLPEVPGETNLVPPEWEKAPEAAVRELAGSMAPHDLPSYLESLFPPAAMAHHAVNMGEGLAQGDVSGVPLIGRIPEIMQADETPAGSKERYLTAMKTLMDLGMLAGGGEGANDPVVSEAPPAQPPPIPEQYQGRFTMVPTPPEQPPQMAPSVPIEQQLPNIQPPPFNPELGPMMQPDFKMPVQTDFAQSPNAQPLFPTPPPGTPLKGTPLVGPNGSTPAADAASAAPQGPPPVSITPGDEPYAGVTPPPGTQEAPIGAANRIATAREQAGLTEAPPSGIGQSWHESVAQGNALIDKGADAYKVVSDFTKTGNISGEKMSVARAWLERLQRANQEARGALEQDPTNPALQQKALDAETAEGAYWQGYQPMKTEWSRIGTGMQEGRGITDADLLNQKTAEQTMREAIDRELTDSDKVRAAKAVSDTRAANARSDAAFDKAIGEATRKAKGPPRSLEQLKNDLAAKLKELTPC